MERIQGSRRHSSSPRREPAQAHFRRLGGGAAALCADSACLFEVYRSDEVRTSSTRFVGGDWHWRLSDGEGVILLDTGGYASERECLGAIGILQQNAGFGRLSRQD